jgi:hypothetical protein
MTRDELIELGKRIVAGEGTENELDELIAIFNRNVPYPHGANLFYWPENYDCRTMIMSEHELTVEEIVDKCLAYKPILL